MGRKAFKYDKVLSKKFGEKVSNLRKNNGLKQDETAFQIGISTSYLSAIERGISDSTISTAKRIAKVFGIELYELFIFNKKKK